MPQQEAMAARLEAANAEVIGSVRVAPSAAWRHPVGEGDRRSAATLAHHIAVGYDRGLEWGLSIRSTGRMVEITPESVDAENAEHALRFPLPDPRDVIDYLEAASAELAVFIRSTGEADLDQPSTNIVMGDNWTLRDVFEATIRHSERHHGQFLAAVKREAGEAG